MKIMKKAYLGANPVKAFKMTHSDFTEYMGVDMNFPTDSDPGYVVEILGVGESNHGLHRNFIYWLPEEAFLKTFKTIIDKDRIYDTLSIKSLAQKSIKAHPISNAILPLLNLFHHADEALEKRASALSDEDLFKARKELSKEARILMTIEQMLISTIAHFKLIL